MGYKIRKLELKSKRQGLGEFEKIGATLPGRNIMVNKIFPVALKIKGVKPRAADILKQEMLSRMGDVVTSRDSLVQTEGTTDVIILGTEKSIRSLAEKIKMQPFGLKMLSEDITAYLSLLSENKRQKTIAIGNKIFDFDNISCGALVMGILNITPDSFFDGGLYNQKENAFRRAEEIVKEGADIIDAGGMSSRPGSQPVSIDEELARVIPVIEHIRDNYDVLISVDTYRSEVAAEALRAGACIVNDISGLVMDEKIISVAAEARASLVIMHMRGTPLTMQENPFYGDVIDEIYDFLYSRSCAAITAGVESSRIIVDPGIGFGKKLEHNIEILAKLKDFTNMGFPVMAGASRKSFIGSLLGGLPADERLYGSVSAAVCAFINGAGILRVHDVKQTMEALKIAAAIKKAT
jgi:dihydropteroate synthase